jgi:hypothetical protein
MFPIRRIILGALASLAANAQPISFQSSERQVPLVELYTSEGCSSCPPAESWVSHLKNKPGLWSEFVPVAFHVDYWDYLGWRDKWAKKQFSDRQRDYAAAWHSENIYTPEFVLNGQEWRTTFGLRSVPGLSETKVGVLKVNSEDAQHWQAYFLPAAEATAGYQINAALLAVGLGSDVKKGENGGRHLEHDFVVLTLVNQPLVHGKDGYQGTFNLAPEQKPQEGRLALAVWTTQTGRLEPVQSVGGWLAPSEKNK